MPVTIEQIRDAKPHDYSYPVALVLLQKLLEDEEIAQKINKEHDLDQMLQNIADGLRKGNIRYLLGRFPEESQKKKIQGFFNAVEDKVGENPKPSVIAAIGEAYLDSDKNIHSGIIDIIYAKLGLIREKEAKIDTQKDPFYKIGAKFLQMKKQVLSNEELVDAIGENHAKMFFIASCEADGKTPDDTLFTQWKKFTGERYAFAEQYLYAEAPAVPHEVKEHKARESKEDKENLATTFSEKKYEDSYKLYQQDQDYQSVDKLSWRELFDEIKREQKEAKLSGTIEYDFDSLKNLLPELKVPLSGKIRLPNELIKKIDEKLAIELQKIEYKPKPRRG